MSNILKIPDIKSISLNRLITSLDKNSYQTFIEIFTEELSLILDSIKGILNSKDIDNNSGVWLDYIGKIIGVKRKGLQDEDYRIALKLRILINNSSGTTEEVQDIVKSFTKSSHTLVGKYPESLSGTVYIDGKENNSKELFELVNNIIPLESQIRIQSDYTGNAFFPSWEVSIESPDQFQTTSDGINYENFQTLDSEGGLEDFYTQRTIDTIFRYWKDKSIPLWEDGFSLFKTFNGTNFETFQVLNQDGTLEDFLITPSIPESITPLLWEVGKDSVGFNKQPVNN